MIVEGEFVVDVKKVNRPKFLFYSKSDYREYGNRFLSILKQRTENMSRVGKTKIPVINGVALIGIDRWKSIEELEKLGDPVWDIVHAGLIKKNIYRDVALEKIVFNEVCIAAGYFLKKPKFASLPHPPKNAVLINPSKVIYWQFCKSGYLITNGIFWCDENLGEVESLGYTIQKYGDKYLIHVPIISFGLSTEGGGKILLFDRGRLREIIQENDLEEDFEENEIVSTYTMKIFDEEDYLMVKHTSYTDTYSKKEFEFAQVSIDGKAAYVPYRLIKKLGVPL